MLVDVRGFDGDYDQISPAETGQNFWGCRCNEENPLCYEKRTKKRKKGPRIPWQQIVLSSLNLSRADVCTQQVCSPVLTRVSKCETV
eukprot:m.223108 g.223108  ORF g.223108 m.223108 type:complete len:87 (-) comp33390_c5_seq1:74-334(-)